MKGVWPFPRDTSVWSLSKLPGADWVPELDVAKAGRSAYT